MTEQQITDRIESLLQKHISSSEVDATEIVTATLSLVIFLYGNSSIQAKALFLKSKILLELQQNVNYQRGHYKVLKEKLIQA